MEGGLSARAVDSGSDNKIGRLLVQLLLLHRQGRWKLESDFKD
jgi:hypothetical protein